MAASPGIYVEIFIRAPLEEVWRLTQDPVLHQQWDLRFSQIQYLPKAQRARSCAATQKRNSPEALGGELDTATVLRDSSKAFGAAQPFLYKTRIGFGLAISGTGENVGQRSTENGEATSALKFASQDWKSLILQGSGYWRYVPVEGGVRFITWYDYAVRWGWFGNAVDRIAFRPLIGWATAWSFDALRLWAERTQSASTSLNLSRIHACARMTIAAIWFWHGLVPKLLYQNLDERMMLADAGISTSLLKWFGASEMAFAVFILCAWNVRFLFLANAFLMVTATLAVAAKSPQYLSAAFNPVTLNLGMFALSLIGWLASRTLPSARHCLRSKPTDRS